MHPDLGDKTAQPADASKPADLPPRRSRLRAPGEAGAFIAGDNTAPGGKLPLNANGGGLP